jgi:secretory phospholipase A2
VFTTFEGNNCNATDVADEITSIIEAAVYAERILHRVP